MLLPLGPVMDFAFSLLVFLYLSLTISHSNHYTSCDHFHRDDYLSVKDILSLFLDLSLESFQERSCQLLSVCCGEPVEEMFF